LKTNFNVTITVKALTDDLHPDDEQDNPEGEHHYKVEADDRSDAVELALDRFHDSVPIKVLDDFEIDPEVN
jgi:hypothetical protein